MENLIGNRIHKLLKENNISQRVLAKRIGSTEASVSRYINGTRTPDARTINKIAKALNVTMEFLLGQEENNTVDEIKIIKSLIERNARNISSQEREKIIEMLYKHKGEI